MTSPYRIRCGTDIGSIVLFTYIRFIFNRIIMQIINIVFSGLHASLVVGIGGMFTQEIIFFRKVSFP